MQPASGHRTAHTLLIHMTRAGGDREENLGKFKSHPDTDCQLLVPMVVSQQVGWLWIQLSGLGWAGLGSSIRIIRCTNTQIHIITPANTAAKLPTSPAYVIILYCGREVSQKENCILSRYVTLKTDTLYDVYIYYALS